MLEWLLRPWAGAAYGRNTAFITGAARYAVKFACTKAYPRVTARHSVPRWPRMLRNGLSPLRLGSLLGKMTWMPGPEGQALA